MPNDVVAANAPPRPRTLQQIQAELLARVADSADRPEEEFFRKAEEGLHQLCEAIAREIGADSAAVLFLNEEPGPGGAPYMVMRGASGRLREIFDRHAAGWRSAAARGAGGPGGQVEDLRGFAYPSCADDDFRQLQPAQQRRDVARWSVTNQIWHLARGRIANSNRAMDDLHGSRGRAGRGDPLAYPGTSVGTTFRSMVGVPIFAQGGGPPVTDLEGEDPAAAEYLASASSREEFLSHYRVVGLVKAEGKRPAALKVRDDAPPRLLAALGVAERSGLRLSAAERQELRDWFAETCAGPPREALTRPFPLPLTDREGDEAARAAKYQLRKAVADVFTLCSQAEFTRRDVELLVLLAMQVGRLLAWRVIRFAAAHRILITENEVGLLNVRWADVAQLVALGRAAGAAMTKVQHHLQALKAELDFAREQDVYRARVSELLDPRGPIREVSGRLKEWPSLVRKLVRKHRQLRETPPVCEVDFGSLRGELTGYRDWEGAVLRGQARLFLHRPARGGAKIDWKVALGDDASLQLRMTGQGLPATLVPLPAGRDAGAPLARRILDEKCYHIDDLAGVRVLTDYDSDVDEVLDEIRAQAGAWNVRLAKVDDAREGKAGGYRAVHVTLQIDVTDLLRSEDAALLRSALGRPGPEGLWVPVEVQLRTAYQHSWALKTHGMSYKREDQIPEDLLDEHEILSNVLAQADWLSDIVRGGIEGMLLPSDFGERRLVAHLKRRIPRDDLNVVRFGVACAKELLKDRVRYNGQPEFSFTMEVCERLAFNFGETDSRFLLLALLRHAWDQRGEGLEGTFAVDGPQPRQGEELLDMGALLYKRLRAGCPAVLERFRHRLPLPGADAAGEPYEGWFKRFPIWFWAMQRSFRNYFLQPPEDEMTPWRVRLREVFQELRRRYAEGHGEENLRAWLERAYVMESAILLANLSELPFEPGKRRRRKLHDAYLALFREIRRHLPNGPTKARVVSEVERAFRDKEMLLDLPRKPEWWEE